MKKLNLIPILGVLLVLFSWGAVEIYKEKRARAEIDRLIDELNLRGKVTYENVDYSLLSGKLEIKGVTWKTGEGRSSVEKITVYKNTPSDLVLSIEGIRAEDDKFDRDMKELGIKDPVLNLYIDASIYDEKRELVIRQMSLSMPDAFVISVNLRLTNINSSLLKDLVEVSEEKEEELRELSAKVAKVKINSFSLSFRDLGLMDRVLEAEARKKKKSKKELIKEVIDGMESRLKDVETEFERDLVRSVISFVKEGGQINFSLNPGRPVEVQELIFTLSLSAKNKDISPLVRDFGMSVSHSK